LEELSRGEPQIQGRPERHLQTDAHERLIGRQDCKIIRLLPIEDGNCLYRIKCIDESVERVVQEGHLAIRQLRE
jgi:hypothetical protein